MGDRIAKPANLRCGGVAGTQCAVGYGAHIYRR
jgi:hypothetical protein